MDEYSRLGDIRGYGRSQTVEHADIAKDVEAAASVLPPGAVDRLQLYKAHRSSSQQNQKDDGDDDGDAYLVDLDHIPGRGPRPGKMFPVMDTHPCTFSFSRGRLVTGLELFGVHGAHVYPASQGHWRYPFTQLLRDLTAREQKFLVGNSLLLPVVGTWMMYVLSNLVCLDDPEPLPMAIWSPDHCEDGDSSDSDIEEDL